MPSSNTISKTLDARLGRYALAVGAVVAAIPAQAAPITVILPSPVDVQNGYTLDIDGVGGPELTFSGLGASVPFLAFVALNQPGALAESGGGVLPLLTGVQLFSSDSFSLWGPAPSVFVSLNTSTSPTFLGVGFATTNGGYNRLAFLQFQGPLLYGYAWEEAKSITTFDITAPTTGVPEPATGALTALALGAVALAARKRKQA
jgi:hypothetical protein